AVALFQATGDHAYLDHADRWRQGLERWYTDDTGTGHYLTASDAVDIPLRLRGDIDDATPSASAQIIISFLRLATASGGLALSERAITLAENALGRAERQTYGQAGLLHAAELVRRPAKLVLVDRPNGELVT